jgi:D-alanyl-D-alanine carboxypeptidase (penicillin-binding protein 5/6)
VHQLLQALLRSSGNDVPHALARALGGVPNALRKMNALAKELGAQDTFAASTSGLDAPGMSTSAYDVALIFRAALKYPEFAQAIATTRAELPATGGHAAIPLRNDNTLLTTYNGALGGKTGFTDDAQATYVGGAQRDGHRLVAVLLRGTRAPLTMPDQAAKLLDYGFGLVGVGEGNPIGKLVDGAPQPKTDEVKATGQAVADGQPKAAGAAPQNSAMTAAFGNAGGPLTIAAALFLLVAFVMYLKRRRAKLARAARAAAASQMS